MLPLPENAPVYREVPVDLKESGNLSHGYLMFTPKLSVVYHLPTLALSNLYLSIGEGFKAGGYNTQMFSDVLQQKLMEYMGLGGKYEVDDIVSYKPEKSWNYEVGAHLNFFNSKLKTDVSLFYIDCFHQQLTVFPEGETTGRLMTNAGRTRSFGGEVSISTPQQSWNRDGFSKKPPLEYHVLYPFLLSQPDPDSDPEPTPDSVPVVRASRFANVRSIVLIDLGDC